MSILFGLLILSYIFRGAQIVWRIGREWSLLKQEPLTRSKKHLAGQASFFIAAPPSVIVHEFFHALAIWFYGGRVVDFGFAFYGGYVRADRIFIPQAEWLIAIAGTIGSLLFGLVVWLILRNYPSRTFRYFGLRTLRTMILISLVFYPLLAIGGFGDWATIYDFSLTPVLSGLTAVTHILFLVLFFWADRRGWFELAGFETAESQTRFIQLEQEMARQPQNKMLAMRYIEALLRGGASQQAMTRLKQYLKQNPDDAEGYALLAGLEANRSNHISKKSKASAEKALHFGLKEATSKATVYRILGEYALEHNQNQEAVNQFSQAIATISGIMKKESPQRHHRLHLMNDYYLRGKAYKRQNNVDLGYQDIEQALDLAKELGDNGRVQAYTQELVKLQAQDGHQLGNSPNAGSPKDVI